MPQIDKDIYSTASRIRDEFGNSIADCYVKCARDNGIIFIPVWEEKPIDIWTGVIHMPSHISSYLEN
jgi:hypothetical protein